MAIRLIHVSDIHFGSGESHGRINPETGLNIRFEDFVAALGKTVDYAITNKADVFVFSGDAYRNASPEPIYQKMFAAQLKRLSQADIKVVLVVGNHDQILRSSQSHAMSVFQTLEVPGLITVDRPLALTLDTAGGALQLIGLPHITRHQLVTLEKYRDFSAAAIDAVLVDHIRDLLRGFYLELDPSLPTVVTAHMATDSALAGIEEQLLVGYTLTFPTEMFIDKRIDYVALGHIHKHQVLRGASPAVVYAGSLERVDFGEEKEDKGFIDVSIERDNTTFAFHSIGPRPFITIDVDLSGGLNDGSSETPQDLTAILAVQLKEKMQPGAVLRLRYKIEQENLGRIDEEKLRRIAADCLSFRLQAEIIPSHKRARMPQLTETSVLDPIAALEVYLQEVNPDEEKRRRLLERAKHLMHDVSAKISGDKDR